MIKARVDIDFAGFDYLQKGSAINRAVRIGINRAAAVVKAALTATAPTRTGSLAKSFRIKVVLHTRTKGGGFSAVIGPSRTFVRKKGKIKAGPRKGEPKVIRPARYAHITERHHHYTWRVYREHEDQFVEDVNREVRAELAKAAALVKKK